MAHSGKEPMPEILPGTYPGEEVPGLDTAIQTAAQLEQQAQQPIRQRNRLQKAATPRTHTYDDSGVAATDTEPLLGASKPGEPIISSSNEPAGSSDYTWDSSTPRAPLETIRSALHTATPEPEVQDESLTRDTELTEVSRGKMAAPVMIGGMASTGSQKMETTSRGTKPVTTSSPYWGDFGKKKERGTTTGMEGGTGYGIEPQARMPQQSRSLEKPTTVEKDSFPSGGVYNTVIGHGSQETEITRPTQTTTTKMGEMAATAPSDDDAMLAVPLDDIPEERSKASRDTRSMDTPGSASSFAREDTRGEDTMAPKPVSRGAAVHESPPKINMASRPAYPHVETQQQESNYWPVEESPILGRGRGPVISQPGSAAISQPTGAAISQPRGTPSSGSSEEQQTKMPSQPPAQHTGEHHVRMSSQSPVRQTGYQPTTITTRPPVEKEKVKTRDDDSIKGERRHSFLGMFHRHKREEPSKEPTAATQQPERSDRLSGDDNSEEDKPWSPIVADMEYIDEHPGPGMKKAAAWEAAGVAGVMGMLHRGKTVSGGSSERRKSSISHPMSPRTGAPSVETKGTREEGKSAPFEHPREPPSPPARREHGTFGPTSLAAPQVPKRAATTKEHGTYGMTTTMSVPDPDITRGDVASREYTKYNTFTSPTGAAERGMTTGETGEYRGAASSYTQAPIATTKGVKVPDTGYYAPASSMQPDTTSTAQPEHKHLQHHTHFTPTAEDKQQSERAGISQEPHGFLAAPIASHSHGTRPNPSQESVPGVTTYSQPPAEHTKTPESYTAPSPRQYRQERETTTDTTTESMPPGAAAAYTPTTGLSPPPARSQIHTAQYPSHPQMSQDTTREAKPENYQGPAPLPLKVHKHGSGAPYVSPALQETEPVKHAQRPTMDYPATAEAAKGMSPEVMPESYTASSKKTEHAAMATGATMAAGTMAAAAATPSTKMGSSQKGDTQTAPEKGMSPDVMPDSYTTSSPRAAHTTATTTTTIPSAKMTTSTAATTSTTQTPFDPIPEHSMSPEVMPDSYTASAIPHIPGAHHTEEISPTNAIVTGMAAIGSGLAAAMGLGGHIGAKEDPVDTEMVIGHRGMGMEHEMRMHMGSSSREKTMFRCTRCGCENDISEVVERARGGKGSLEC